MAPPRPIVLTLGRQPLPEVIAALRAGDVRFNAYAESLFDAGGVSVAPTPTQIHVEVHTVGELGWAAGAPLDPLIRALAPRGFAPCPLEAALLLRLAWRARVVSPRITVASLRAIPLETEPRGFYLRDDDEGCWLRAFVASDDWVAGPEERLALCRRSP